MTFSKSESKYSKFALLVWNICNMVHIYANYYSPVVDICKDILCKGMVVNVQIIEFKCHSFSVQVIIIPIITLLCHFQNLKVYITTFTTKLTSN